MPCHRKDNVTATNCLEISGVSADIIRTLKKEYRLTNAMLARKLGFSEAQIRDLEDEETKKVSFWFVAAVRQSFGIRFIQPLMELMGCKAIEQSPALPVNPLSASLALASKAAALTGNGTAPIDHVALAAMLPELQACDSATSALLSEARRLGMLA